MLGVEISRALALPERLRACCFWGQTAAARAPGSFVWRQLHPCLAPWCCSVSPALDPLHAFKCCRCPTIGPHYVHVIVKPAAKPQNHQRQLFWRFETGRGRTISGKRKVCQNGLGRRRTTGPGRHGDGTGARGEASPEGAHHHSYRCVHGYLSVTGWVRF